MVTDAPADSPAHALNTSVIDILQLLIMMASSLSVCSVDSAALSKAVSYTHLTLRTICSV